VRACSRAGSSFFERRLRGRVAPFHTPDEVAAAFVTGFAGLGYDVALNTPFAGALVPLERYRQDQRVHSVMIEVRRDLYMDESTGAMLPDYGHVRARLQNMLVF
jgi:N-formylglutamate amidohydrolase